MEADQQQVNLNRFSLFFPEKRPFFLENAGRFTVGGGTVNLFHSRRIGIGEGGRQLPIDGGARVSGKLGRATNVGLLHMRVGEAEGMESAEPTDFSVLRVSRELPSRSAIGMFFANRDGAGSDNQTFAVDGWVGLGEVASVVAWAAKTRTPGHRRGRPRLPADRLLRFRGLVLQRQRHGDRRGLQSGSGMAGAAGRAQR